MISRDFLDKLKVKLNSMLDSVAYYGRGRKNATFFYFKNNVIGATDFNPVFVLSTGRVGTKLLTNVLSSSSQFDVHHSSKPELITEGRRAYELYTRYPKDDGLINTALGSTVSAARDEMLYQAYIYGSTYVETNNRISFLAPAIANYLPHSRFVHIYRHPGEFIRSGIRRGWYCHESNHELGRIAPLVGSQYYDDWSDFSQIEKVAWLWNETNSFIEKFIEGIDQERCYVINFDDIQDENVVSKLIGFLGGEIDASALIKQLSIPVNQERGTAYPLYDLWSDQDKLSVKRICGRLASKYGYQL